MQVFAGGSAARGGEAAGEVWCHDAAGVTQDRYVQFDLLEMTISFSQKNLAPAHRAISTSNLCTDHGIIELNWLVFKSLHGLAGV